MALCNKGVFCVKKLPWIRTGILELSLAAFLAALIWLIPGNTPVVDGLAGLFLGVSVISAFWGGLSIGSARGYEIGFGIRIIALAAEFALLQGTDFLSGGPLWILMTALVSAIIVMLQVLKHLSQQDGIIEKWKNSRKLDVQRRFYRLEVRRSMYAEKNERLINGISVVVIVGAFLWRIAAKLSPEIETPGLRLIFLFCAAFMALGAANPIGSAIILGRIEREHGIVLETEYDRRR